MKPGIIALLFATASTFAATTGLNWQIWTNLGNSTKLSALKESPNYPEKPAFGGVVSRFDFHTNIADYYGCRVMGYITAPTTGEYTFYLAADDEGELYLSNDDQAGNKKIIASNPGYTGWKNWNKFKSQTSSPIKLEAGKKYYVEALFKEAAGDEYLSVAWEGPGIKQQIIPGKYLSTVNEYSPEKEFIVPTKKNPMKNNDLAACFKMALQIQEAHEPPADEVVPHPAGYEFPGKVAENVQRVTKKVVIDGSYDGNDPRFCYAGVASTVYRSTGLYAAPGEKITVKIPDWCKDQGLGIQIGCHTDQLWHLKNIQRVPTICRWDQLKDAVTVVANGFGGLVYITVPAGKTLGRFEAEISGGVNAPWYRHGKTDLKDWVDKIRNYPAPMAELQTDKLIITLPAKHIRELDNPKSLMNFWNDVMDACADVSSMPRQRVRAERMVFDRQISAGWMHSGYPLMGPNVMADKVVNEKYMREKGDWGCFHEIGHNHQCWDWVLPGETEVTVNLYSVYVYEMVNKRAFTDTHPCIKEDRRTKDIKSFFKTGKKGAFCSLQTYLMLREAFGWDLFKQVFADYNRLDEGKRPRETQARIDRFIETFCRYSGYNLIPYFEAWGYKITDPAKQRCAVYREWKENPMIAYLKLKEPIQKQL